MSTEPQRPTRGFRRLAALVVTATIGLALTWFFCYDYVWLLSHPNDGRRLLWEPESLVAITVLQFALLAVFIIRAAIKGAGVGTLALVIGLLSIFNIVLTIFLFGIPAY